MPSINIATVPYIVSTWYEKIHKTIERKLDK